MTSWGQDHDRADAALREVTMRDLLDALVLWLCVVAAVGYCWGFLAVVRRWGSLSGAGMIVLTIGFALSTPYLLDRFATRKRLTTRKDDQPRAEVAASTPRGTSDHNLPRNER